MGLRSNGEEGSIARRNKYHMGEKVRSAGVRAVGQRLCRSPQDLKEFLLTLLNSSGKMIMTINDLTDDTIIKCVVKPVQSAGSDDVFLCNTVEEALVALSRISGKKNGLGLVNDGALCQEFLAGKEYVIDKVSLDGVHKLIAIWQYDKRVCNGANFVYFGMKLVSSESQRSQDLVAYSSQVLNALGIRQGPSHMEVMWCGADPVTGQSSLSSALPSPPLSCPDPLLIMSSASSRSGRVSLSRGGWQSLPWRRGNMDPCRSRVCWIYTSLCHSGHLHRRQILSFHCRWQSLSTA
jgi:hypothetical protein